MKQSIFLVCLIVCMLPQCAKVRHKKIFEPVVQESRERIALSPDWSFDKTGEIIRVVDGTQYTIDDAIRIGLERNPSLQAHFDKMGIAKADLIQAGFYTNPSVESVFHIPKKDQLQTSIDVSASFMLSDLWQVPLKKKVAQRILDVTTYEVIKDILQLRQDIQLAYFACQYKKEYAMLVEDITTSIQAIKERIDYRYQFGFHTDLEKYVAQSTLGQWQAKMIHARAELSIAYTQLQEKMGVPIGPDALEVVDTVCVPSFNLSQEKLAEHAATTHPYILIEQAKIAQARAQVRYEKSRVIDNVQVGVSYERDFEKKVSGIGPTFGINIPLFDLNYGNIERAKFEMGQAQQMLHAQERMIAKDIAHHYTLYSSYIKQIEQYNQSVIPSTIDALEFSEKFFDTMQMSFITFLTTHVDLLQHQLTLLELRYKAGQEYVKLEFSFGAQLQNV